MNVIMNHFFIESPSNGANYQRRLDHALVGSSINSATESGAACCRAGFSQGPARDLVPWNKQGATDFQIGALDPVGALDGGDGSAVFTGDGPESVAFFNRVTDGLGGDFNRFWFWLRS